MAAAPPPPQLGAGDGDDLDALLAELGVGAHVAVVGHHHARLQRHHVVAVVPLLALLLEGVAAGGDHAQLLEAERLPDDLQERLLLPPDVQGAGPVAGPEAERPDLLDPSEVDVGQVAVAQGEDRVQVHRRPALGEDAGDDALRRLLGEQRPGDLADGLHGGALAHADEDDAVADGHHVAALDGRRPVVGVGIAEPDLEPGVLERRVERVDRRRQQGLLAPGRPVHRVEGDAAVDPAGGVAGEQRVRQRGHDEARSDRGARRSVV